jgi:hypothetical protein
MEDPRYKIAAVEMEDPRCKSLRTGVMIQTEDLRCRTLRNGLVIEMEDHWSRRASVAMEDPRCGNLSNRW